MQPHHSQSLSSSVVMAALSCSVVKSSAGEAFHLYSHWLLSIAVILAPCSEALESSTAFEQLVLRIFGISSAISSSLDLQVFFRQNQNRACTFNISGLFFKCRFCSWKESFKGQVQENIFIRCVLFCNSLYKMLIPFLCWSHSLVSIMFRVAFASNPGWALNAPARPCRW